MGSTSGEPPCHPTYDASNDASAEAQFDDALLAVLAAAQTVGLLGPGPIDAHVRHAAAFVAAATAAGRPVPATVLDMGSGGGVPGLILARIWPSTRLVLLDAAAKRGAFLGEACARLGLDDRVRVVVRRAEVAGRDPAFRSRFDAVTARSFGPPAVTAECGLAFLVPDGVLLVSEPPDAPADRWPTAGLAALGLVDDGVTEQGSAHVRRLRRRGELADAVPRRDGMPAKRPLF